MAKVTPSLHSFNAGEASNAALARVDQETIRLTAERQENLLPYVVGKAIMRPGTQYLNTGTSTPDAANTLAPFLIPFKRSASDTALLELSFDANETVSTGAASDLILRAYVDDEIVTYPTVVCTIGDPTFTGSGEWTSVLTAGATVTYDTGTSGTQLSCVLQAPSAGARATIKQHAVSSSPNVLHCLRVVVGNEQSGDNAYSGANNVNFRVGSTDGGDELVALTSLPPGVHYLAFTPPGVHSSEIYIQFDTASPVPVIIRSCDFASSGEMRLPLKFLPLQTENPNLAAAAYTQSLDVIFLTLGRGIQPLMIQKRGPSSWSFCYYYTSDGPFQVSQSDSSIYLTPSATRGTITLTSSATFFNEGQVGELIQITHDSMNATYGIAGQNVSTPAFRVSGIQKSGDRDWIATIAGTWAGTITVERSFDNQYSGFAAYRPNDQNSTGTPVTITGNGTQRVNDADDNVIVWYRFTFTTYTSGSAQITINYGSYGFTGICRVVSVTSVTQATAEVLTPFANITPSKIWLEGEWNANFGYPSAVALFDGRLWWARDDQFWGSVSNQYFSFSLTISDAASGTQITGASSSIQRNVATGGSFDDVIYMLPLQRLVFGTSGAEVSARASALDAPLTPTDITLKDGSTQGTANAQAVKIDKRGAYIQRSTHKIYELDYNVYQSDYDSKNLMRINEDLGYPEDPDYTTGFTHLAVQRQPETYIWARRSDGICCVLLYEPAEKVQGWFRVTTGQDEMDQIISSAVLPGVQEDAVYFVVRRTVGASSAYYIEKMRPHRDTVTRAWDAINKVQTTASGLYQVDCHITASAVSGAYQTITGLGILEGRDVMALGYNPVTDTYGPIGGIYTVDGGVITLTDYVEGIVTVGLPYGGYYKSSRLAYGAPQGSTALLQKKRVTGAGLLLQDTHPNALLIGSDFDGIETMDPLPRIEDLLPVQTSGTRPRIYDKQMFPIANVWDTDARICVEVQPGYSATLLGIVVGVEMNETA